MAQGIGVSITERIAAALVMDNAIFGDLVTDPEDSTNTDSLHGVPADAIVWRIAEQVRRLPISDEVSHVGLAMPGIIRGGVVEDSPNLAQLKRVNMQGLLSDAL